MDSTINHSNTDQQFSKSNIINGLRILVVDDEADSLDILIMILEQEEAQLIPVTSAADALVAFNQTNFDLIISDIGMPEIDGYTLIKKIRTLPKGKNIPAIALSAYANENEQQLSLDAGFQIHLCKPVIIPELIAAITELVS